ncbi:DUF401 family protein [Ruminococcaceae bacterium OttesenSCG-928-N02]|nr:DUF401 family protein [Ruminococcaceae bacterium OttesenSCG-928-N02]
MDLLRIVAIMLVIVTMTRFKKPLWMAIGAAALTTGIVFFMPPMEFLQNVWTGATSITTLTLAFVIYALTFLQNLMEEHKMLKQAELSMTSLLNNRRLTTAITPVLIGLMPAPGAVLMAASVVEGTCEDHLSKEDMAFVTSFYRHVPESSLPTYSSVILATAISGVPMGSFLMAMLPFLAIIMVVPYFLFLRKVPKETGMPKSESKVKDLGNVIVSLSPIILIIVLILGLGFQTWQATLAAIVVLAIWKFKDYNIIQNFVPLATKSFNRTMILSTFFSMIFKQVLTSTGVVARLPAMFEGLPIPTFMVFSIIFFAGTFVGGLQTMIPLILPVALATVPGSPAALLMLLMATGHLAAQVNPTHLCLTLSCEYFGVGLGDLIKKTVPTITISYVLTTLYYVLIAAVL